MKTRVRLSLLIICSLICTACTNTTEAEKQPQPQTVPVQDTLGMVPDFSYVVAEQIPNIFVDNTGYRPDDKKVAFFRGDLEEQTFDVIDLSTDETVYSGALFKTKEMNGENLYAGDFTGMVQVGKYYIRQSEIGDSYEFEIAPDIYEKEFTVLQRLATEYTYTKVSDAAYVLANMLFLQEMFGEECVDTAFVEDTLAMLLNSQDTQSGAFYSEITEEPGSVSLTATAQMAGVLAKYSYLYKETNPLFSMQCSRTAQSAYKYMEQYRGNTDTDAWYYAATELFRATGQYKYRNAIREYDAMEPGLKSRTVQNYTAMADFTYLSTTYGTDYARCAMLLDGYMDKAQSISVSSTRDNFYVLPDIATMADGEILDDMIILGVVNHVLSGKEYEGIERNYIHYLSGVNPEAKDYLAENVLLKDDENKLDTTNIAKMMVIYGNIN